MPEPIKSPISKDIVFGKKIKQLFNRNEVKGAFVFYIPQEGDPVFMSTQLCSHQLQRLSEDILKKVNTLRMGEDECEA